MNISKTKEVKITDDVIVGGEQPLTLIGGPCSIENEKHALFMAKELKKITKKVGVSFIYKSCYNKDSRSSINSFHGIGLEKGLKILQKVKDKVNVPVTSDFSDVAWVKETAKVVDLLQVPAFLCRQTHVVTAAGKSGIPVNIKKGPFLAPWDMINVVKKVESTGNKNILLTDKGTSFGYNFLVTDMRSFPIMQKTGYPVVCDATHSIQLPGGLGKSSGGQREFIPTIALSSIASGANALFIEIHDNPSTAPCDGPNMLNLNDLGELLKKSKEIYEIVREGGDIDE